MGLHLTLGKKIGGGYALISLILAIAVLTTIFQVQKAAEVTDRIIELRMPTSQSSLGMLNGINHSLAALRGWIILGDDKFKAERATAWSQEIEPSYQAMKALSKHWTNPENVRRLATLEDKLKAFQTYQQEIEDVAQTRENEPALKILLEQATPQTDILAASITRMIDLELGLAASAERKALLGMMADVRGTTGLALASIRAYLLSGDAKFKTAYDQLWEKNDRRFKDLQDNAALLTPDQAGAFEAFKDARAKFVLLPPQMFGIRSGDAWNLANAWLGTKAAPTASAIKEVLDAMVENQRQLMQSDVNEAEQLRNRLKYQEWAILLIGLVACGILGLTLTRRITSPILEAVAVAGKMANGDLSQEIRTRASDETGLLLKAMEEMRQGLSRIFTGLRQESGGLVAASGRMIQISVQMSGNAEDVAGKSGTVAVAAEEMSANMASVAAAVEQAGTNVGMVADASSQMAQTIAEIAGNSEKARGTTAGAVDKAKQAAGRVAALGDAASAIGKVTQTINDISEQTNLLALNATIEAARAGEAGKGFAVVAGEIKELARQTAEATREIREKIDGIQNSTSATIEEINQILDVILEINDIVSATASAVEEQSVTTREIADNVSQASLGINEITQNVSQSSTVSVEVARDIVDVDQAAGKMSGMSRDISGCADELRELADRLNGAVARFKL